VVAATVLPVSAVREWTHAKPPFTAEIYAPLIRNRLCVAAPKARPATRLSHFLVQLTRDLGLKHLATRDIDRCHLPASNRM